MKLYKLLPIILLTLKAYASDDVIPERDFRCFTLAPEIKTTYKSSDRNQVSQELKKLIRENLRLKWSIYDQLAKKIGKQIDDIKEYYQIFQIIDLAKDYSRKAHGFEYNNLDSKLNLLFEPLDLPQLKLLLSLVHRATLNHEILLCAITQAPNSLWQGAEYVTLQPVQELEQARKEFFDCQALLWKHYFPESYKIEQTNRSLVWAHAFKGLDDNLQETTATQYFEQLYRCFTSCGRNCGRKKSEVPKVFLMEPRKRLFEFSMSPQFTGLFNIQEERRIIRYPTIEAINAVLPWSVFIPTTIPCSRYVGAVQVIKNKVKLESAKPKKTLKNLALTLKENEVVRLSDETQALKEMLAKLEEKILSLTKLKKCSEEKFTSLQDKYNNVSRTLQELKGNLSEQHLISLKEDKERLVKQLKDERDRNTSLRATVEKLTSEVNEAAILLEESQRKLAQSNKSHQHSLVQLQEKHEQQIRLLQDEIKSHKTEIDQLHNTKANLEKKLKNNNNKRLASELQKQKTEKEKLKQELKQKQAQLEEHIAAANKFLATQEETVNEEAPEQNNNLEATNQNLQAQIQFLQANLHQAGQLVQHLTHWCSYLQQGWGNAQMQMSSIAQSAEKIITVDGEDFCLTPEEQDQILRDHLLVNVIQKREQPVRKIDE